MSIARRHRDCANYDNGVCRLYNIRVDPDAPACPMFTPRGSVEGGQQPTASIAKTQPPQYPVAQPPRPVRARRRLRRRLRRGFFW